MGKFFEKLISYAKVLCRRISFFGPDGESEQIKVAGTFCSFSQSDYFVVCCSARQVKVGG